MVYDYYMKGYETIRESTISLIEANSSEEAIEVYIEEVGIFDTEFLAFIYNKRRRPDEAPLKELIFRDKKLAFDERNGLELRQISHSIAVDTFKTVLGDWEDDSLFEKYREVVEQYIKDSDRSETSYRKGFNKELLVFIYKYLWNPLAAKEMEVIKKVG